MPMPRATTFVWCAGVALGPALSRCERARGTAALKKACVRVDHARTNRRNAVHFTKRVFHNQHFRFSGSFTGSPRPEPEHEPEAGEPCADEIQMRVLSIAIAVSGGFSFDSMIPLIFYLW